MSVFDLPTASAVIILAFTAVVGLCLGSFLNCAAWRLSHGESVSRGRSHCALCGHTLGPAELIPLFSYAFLGGRCRWCGGHISARYPAVEAICAAAYVLCVVRFGLTFEALRAAVLTSLLLCLSLVDLDTLVIPDRFHVAGIIWWLVTLPLVALGKSGGFLQELWRLAADGLLGGFCIAVPLLLISLVMDRALGRESMGGGDIKLFFTVGLYLGPLPNLLNIIVSCIAGLIFGIIGRAKGKAFPFGPSVSFAAFVTLLAGRPLLDWYLSLL